MDWTIYWFMFPISICVATTAMLSGIGGAALFTPIFLIAFPILGPEYPLATPAAAVGAALATTAFGFASGFVGYYRRRLIDFRAALPFIAVAVPVAVVGALFSHAVDQSWLKATYAALMLVLFAVLLRNRAAVETAPESVGEGERDAFRAIRARDGTVWRYPAPRQGKGAAGTAVGGFLTGMVSVGIGETVMPQLVRRNRVPVPVAAATSVLVVIVTVASASFAHISALIAGGGLGAVPWNLVCWTIPGVIVGGQIGPRLQGRLPQRGMEKSIAALFGIIGMAMAWIAWREIG